MNNINDFAAEPHSYNCSVYKINNSKCDCRLSKIIKISDLKVGDRIKCRIHIKIKTGNIAFIGKYGILVYLEPLNYYLSKDEPLASPVDFENIISKLEPITEYKEIPIEKTYLKHPYRCHHCGNFHGESRYSTVISKDCPDCEYKSLSKWTATCGCWGGSDGYAYNCPKHNQRSGEEITKPKSYKFHLKPMTSQKWAYGTSHIMFPTPSDFNPEKSHLIEIKES